jgi:hypothetical protein
LANTLRVKALKKTIDKLGGGRQETDLGELASCAFIEWIEQPGREVVRDDFLAHLKKLVAVEETRA